MPEANYDLIPFPAEISGNPDVASVHCTKKTEGPARMPPREIIAMVDGKSIDDAGKTWRRLSPDMMAELAPDLSEFKFNVGVAAGRSPFLRSRACSSCL